jgi:hypothetical protein
LLATIIPDQTLWPAGHEGTWPHAMKMAMSATSTEVVDWMFHWVPSGA